MTLLLWLSLSSAALTRLEGQALVCTAVCVQESADIGVVIKSKCYCGYLKELEKRPIKVWDGRHVGVENEPQAEK